VWPDHHRVGYEAAALLDKMMRGEKPPDAAIYVPPRGVVTRPSTDVLAIEDRDIATAVRFIRQHACEGPTIDDVARHVSMSRSSLQRRFKRIVGRTLHEEMLRMRLARARELLGETKADAHKLHARQGLPASLCIRPITLSRPPIPLDTFCRLCENVPRPIPCRVWTY
jgi:LacI family transcriptional regulator